MSLANCQKHYCHCGQCNPPHNLLISDSYLSLPRHTQASHNYSLSPPPPPLSIMHAAFGILSHVAHKMSVNLSLQKKKEDDEEEEPGFLLQHIV